MTLLAIMLVTLMCLFHSTDFAHKIFLQLNKGHASYSNNAEDCPTQIDNYWFSDYPDHCVPPPTDHAAEHLEEKEAAASLCVYVRHIETLHDIMLKGGKQCLNL